MLNEFVLTVWGKKFSGFENFLGFEFAHKEQEDLLCITGSVLALEPVLSRPALQRFLWVCGGVGERGEALWRPHRCKGCSYSQHLQILSLTSSFSQATVSTLGYSHTI